ncbi:MAG: DUF2283 domain-containing protein [Candidatus Nanohaloarchaea archaeon]
MEAEEIRYDREADILYLWSEKPEETENVISEEIGDEILVERDAETGERIGITIMHFSKRNDAAEGIDLSRTPEIA